VLAELNSFLEQFPLWQAAVIVLGLSGFAAIAIELVGVNLAKRLVARTESEFDDILFEELRVPIIVSVFLLGVYILTQSPAAAAAVGGPAVLNRFFGNPSLTIIIIAWGWGLNQIVNRSVEELVDDGRHRDFAPVFSNVWTLAIVATVGFLILSLWGIEITPLLGAAGVAGIAIGFAAKDTVANFFGGLALYVDDTYKLGDFVMLESGETGTVVKVGIRSTTLLTRSEVLVTVPNSMLNAGKVINESVPQRRKRIKVPIGVAYGTDIDAFEALLLDIADQEELILDSPTPRARFRGFGDSALTYELLCWVAAPTREGKARHNLNRAIYQELRSAGIEIPYPKRDVTIGGATAPERPDTPISPPEPDFDG